MPGETPVRLVRELASRGFNAEREAVTLLAGAPDPLGALERAVETLPDDAFTLSADHVRNVLDATPDESNTSTGQKIAKNKQIEGGSAVETKGVEKSDHVCSSDDTAPAPAEATAGVRSPPSAGSSAKPAATTESPQPTASSNTREGDRSPTPATITGDITGESTGTGEYTDFVSLFRDRYERLSAKLRSRVNHRPTDAIASMPGGSDVGVIGMVNDIRSTKNGHWLVELEDTNGSVPCLVLKDRDIAPLVEELLFDEVIAVEGTLADEGDLVFVDSLFFPDVPRTYQPSTADRHVQAALISDVHVGSREFMVEAWNRFADWLYTDEAEAVEYLLIAGDMVEGVGVYPGQDEELSIVDIYEQYAAFAEHLKAVPGDLEIVMIPGNHDAVRLAEPQPAFDEELRDIMRAHDAHITGNPSMVTVEGVSVLMYHGVSLDEVIAELPEGKASYDDPHLAMAHLLKKRHLAPKYGGRMRIAPEKRDYLVIDDVPDVLHSGHVHKLGVGGYRNVRVVNSGCWQSQTDFQRSVNIDPDAGYAPILDLDTLDVTVRSFG